MKIICFPHFYYLSEVSRLLEIGKALRSMGQEILFFSHGGPYENIVKDEGFEVAQVAPLMSQERAQEYFRFNRGEGEIDLKKSSFFSLEELEQYVPNEVHAFKNEKADAVLIGWNLPSYLSAQLAGIPIIVQQPGSFIAPFYEKGMGEFVPSVLKYPYTNLLRLLPMNRIANRVVPRSQFWIYPFNEFARKNSLPEFKSTLDLIAGDLTVAMDAPEILGIRPDELENYVPSQPEYFHRPPKYRYGGPCFAKLPGEVPREVKEHFDTKRAKLFCAMGVSGSPSVLHSLIEIIEKLDLQAVVVTTTILKDMPKSRSERVLLLPHVPAHRVNPMADIAITHGGAGTVQTAIHSGTPLIGIPMHIEQGGNLAMVQRQGAGILLWKQELSYRNLSKALEKITQDQSYKENMMRLKQMQDSIDGAHQAAREIVAFLQEDHQAIPQAAETQIA